MSDEAVEVGPMSGTGVPGLSAAALRERLAERLAGRRPLEPPR